MEAAGKTKFKENLKKRKREIKESYMT